MKLSNFKLTKITGESALYKIFHATIDIETGVLWWKKKVNVKIQREYGRRWFFVDTGEYTPGFNLVCNAKRMQNRGLTQHEQIQIKSSVYDSVEIAPGQHRCQTIQLDEPILYNAIEPLDLPSPTAYGISKMLCSSESTIKRVMQSRKWLAGSISTAITKALLKILSTEDTEMGYEQTKGGHNEQ